MCDRGYVMAGASDSYDYLFKCDMDLMRLKVERNKWLLTVDGVYVRASQVVSLRVPDDEEVESYLEGAARHIKDESKEED